MYKCTKCNSTAVEYLDWIDLNTGEPRADGLDEFYCRTCEAHTEVVYETLDGDIIHPDGTNTNKNETTD